MAVAERVWFVVSFVTTPCWKPACLSLSDALRARPVNVVPLRTATLTLLRLTFAGAAAPLEALLPPAAGVLADPAGATVFGLGAGVLSSPPRTDTPTTIAMTATAAMAAMMAASLPRERPAGAPGRPARAAPAAVRGGTVACAVEARRGAAPRLAAAAVAGAVAGTGRAGGFAPLPLRGAPVTGAGTSSRSAGEAGAGAGAGSTAVAPPAEVGAPPPGPPGAAIAVAVA